MAIVGSGPAGLSAAAHAAALGMSHVLLEKTDHLSDTIYKYQKGKHVMATPSNLVLRSDLDFDAGKREAMLGTWDEQTGGAQGQRAATTPRSPRSPATKGDFTLKTKSGRRDRRRDGGPGDRHAGQSQPGALPGRRGRGGPVPARRSRRIHRRAHHRDRRGRRGDRERDGPRRRSAAAQHRHHRQPLGRFRHRQGRQRRGAAGDGGRRADHRAGSRPPPRRSTRARSPSTPATARSRRRCDRVIARMGSAPPRAFVEGICAEFEEKDGKKAIKPGTGIEFTSADRVAYPKLSPTFESTVPGIYVIGALAGYPLIKHCMNQGYDVIEFINGNTDAQARRRADPGGQVRRACRAAARSTSGSTLFGSQIEIFKERLAAAAARADARQRRARASRRARRSSSATSPAPRCSPSPRARCWSRSTRTIRRSPCRSAQGSIFGEVGLISGRRRGATIRAAEPTVCVELSRSAALKLLATAPGAARAVNRISIERQLLQMFGSGLTTDGRRRAGRGGRGRGHARRRGGDRGRRRRQGHLRHPPRLDDRREEHRRAAGVPVATCPPAPTSARWR